MKTMKDYCDLYLNCGVLFLADVFEKLRNSSLNNRGLCPSHFLSAPGFSWDEMLNLTKVEFELISDEDMYLFFEKVLRSGISYISKRYCKESKPNMYLDADNYMVKLSLNFFQHGNLDG